MSLINYFGSSNSKNTYLNFSWRMWIYLILSQWGAWDSCKITVFYWNLLQNSCFFRFFAAKTLKKTISTSVSSAQHPNAGQNIQQISSCPPNRGTQLLLFLVLKYVSFGLYDSIRCRSFEHFQMTLFIKETLEKPNRCTVGLFCLMSIFYQTFWQTRYTILLGDTKSTPC